MEVICLEDEALYALIDKVIERLDAAHARREDKWVAGEEAMRRLGVTSKTTMQKLRDEGKLKFTQPQKKIILYDTESIDLYLERHSRKTF